MIGDIRYKQALIRGIQERYQFTPKIEALNSVLSPNELKVFLRNIPSRFFDVGDSFENVREGNYRVNLHTHTIKSDGSMTPLEYLEQSVRYADKAAKIKKDNFPPYISATTDHNNFEASQEVIAMIADEPEKYKNFRFAAGCEFMFLDEESGFKYPAFEAVGLGVNPFAKLFLDKFNPINIINKIKEFGAVLSYAHPIRYCQGNGQTQAFIDYLKRIGIDGIESNYQYVGFCESSELSEQILESKRIAKENNLFETGGTDTHGSNIFHARAQKILDTLI
ncbi:MAG: hypothetical protein NC408_02675 [Candidatus Gastranaerophilales bacterium]|nr:hypothetical protein [Candidatus Gastranaerophilales bacterium]MCM1073288.1 hypothetical protein [Bacteroides sp.]